MMQKTGVEVIYRITIHLTAADCGPLLLYENSSMATSVLLKAERNAPVQRLRKRTLASPRKIRI